MIALDAMGGDHGPEVTVAGAALSLTRHPNLRFKLFGNRELIAPVLARHEALQRASEIIHTDAAIGMDEKPSQALRQGRTSSMWLRPIADIERPAIAAIWPTVRSECIVLDVGANIGASASQLCDFALMGAAMARALFHIERPSVGLLNVGAEEIKGNEEVKQAHQLLRDIHELPFDYRGFVEGDEIGQGRVDVVVVEGFAGNIALKTAEGTARQIGQYLKDAMTRSLLSRIGAFLAQGGFRVLKNKMDPRRVNGGTFLGLNGLAVKSHGGTDALGFASAIDIGQDMAESGLVGRLRDDLNDFHGRLAKRLAS
jgi:glycerol-3-phosphate acyltransferase PlsX